MYKDLDSKILAIIRSRRFYKFIIGFFIFESVWIALTASYPQAFDENYHFGLIQIYSHYWLPFLSHQPPNANAYGAVARDASYLYHYLMSFPYRLLNLVTKRESYQIIFLRLINVGLFTGGLLVFKRILSRTRLSEGLANIVLLLFCLIPIVPQLAGQINYDNMLFPLAGLVFLLAFDLIDQIKALKLSFVTLSYLIILCILTSLVKYAFLPIFLGIVCFFVYFILRHYRHKIAKLWSSLTADFQLQSVVLKVLLVGGLIVSIGMFAQRDLANIIEYHAVEPDCSKVLSIKACNDYSPWLANYSRHQAVITNHHPAASHDPIYFIMQWLYWMWYRLFFAVNGPNTQFQNFPPLPLPSAIGALIGVVGTATVIRYRRELLRTNPYALFMLVATLFYVIALMLQGYSTYQFTAVLENMNGRYLLPVLLLVVAMFAQAFSIALSKSRSFKIALACVVVLLFVDGGGILTFISRSDPSWDWQNPKVISVNNAARKITKPLVISGSKTYGTPYWFFN